MTKIQHCQANDAPRQKPGEHRLCVGLSELTLAKRPAEFARITELHAAIRALARETARSDHVNKS
ncbi:hypothetical protein EDD53_1344 [Pacificibacter maritimus]|uniref:Uncharacterized protein n=1 Tax=Pacificibacter maritimus TaxID=762213 RepID=A0A3N4UU02_9RHOB|nr:hypothetical protein EDD53_1344 [Pacificibacter maritimus]